MYMENSKRIVLAWELYEEGMSRISIATHLGLHRETIGIWIKGIQRDGLEGFLDSYEHAKKVPRRSRQVDPILKRRIWSIREREHDCCGQKIAYF